METKKCSKCGEVKLFSEFYKHKSRKDGLHSQCKCCANKTKEVWRKKHLKEIKEYHKKDRALLKNWYIMDTLILLGWRKENITEEIIKEQRNIIKTKRLINKINQSINKKTKTL